ncbi:HNH endonuclease signature motif containing protein [Enterococcus sp. 4E1_DIV0656]|uniref:HNH endonuclease signature motif containing protein n=1 Tax=Enterococcus sp. 4E1_DIV0656 TaxID=1834180 RepID=UPI00111DE2EB|nr:HNH endonuclease signature motif containing protein [Enterococcus sp. 4E1_DIV0656]
MYNQLKTYGYSNKGSYLGKDKGILPYLKSEMVRYIMDYPILPIGFIKTKNARLKNHRINKYNKEGRVLIHQNQKAVDETMLAWLRNYLIKGKRGNIEVNDNRISLFVGQGGKCSVTREVLEPGNFHLHHKIPWYKTKDDSYWNLTLVLEPVHQLIHAIKEEIIQKYLLKLDLSKEQLLKVNKYRKILELEPINLP